MPCDAPPAGTRGRPCRMPRCRASRPWPWVCRRSAGRCRRRPRPPPARPDSAQEERGAGGERDQEGREDHGEQGTTLLLVVRLVLVPAWGAGRGVQRGGIERLEVERWESGACMGHGVSLSAGARDSLESRHTRCPGQPNGPTLAERPRPPTDRSGAPVASSEDQGCPMAPSAFTCAWSTCSAYLPPVALSTASPPRAMAWSLSCSTWSGWSPASS